MSATATLRTEVTELLQELIRTDTVNPPGNETAAAELLREYLESNGVRGELYAKVPDRANLVARIPGSGDGPRLALLSHTDTVLADASEWDRDPFGGDVHEGEVWGRGALDMKGQVAASAVAIASLARDGFEPRGDLIFVAAADEEVNVDFGLSWLCREHPDAVRAEYALNEGGGDRVDLGGRQFYLAATAEKMSAPFLLRTRGRSGHASMPSIADNALLKATALVDALGAYRHPPTHTPESEAFFRQVLGDVPPIEEAIARAGQLHPLFRGLFEALVAPTYAPTMIKASQKRNVIPNTCEVEVDSRLLPGQTTNDSAQIVRAVLGDLTYELEWVEEGSGGTRSPAEGPLWDAMSSWVAQADPGAGLAPICLAGFTDSHWMRAAFGTVAYGFFPARMPIEVSVPLVHSANERIPVDDLELGVDFFRAAAQHLLG